MPTGDVEEGARTGVSQVYTYAKAQMMSSVMPEPDVWMNDLKRAWKAAPDRTIWDKIADVERAAGNLEHTNEPLSREVQAAWRGVIVRMLRVLWLDTEGKKAAHATNRHLAAAIGPILRGVLPVRYQQLLEQRFLTAHPESGPGFAAFAIGRFYDNLHYTLPTFQADQDVLSWLFLCLDSILEVDSMTLIELQYSLFGKGNFDRALRLEKRVGEIINSIMRRVVSLMEEPQLTQEDWEDLRQDTFLKAWAAFRMENYFPVSSPYAYIKRILRNLIIDRAGSKAREDELNRRATQVLPERLVHPPPPLPDPGEPLPPNGGPIDVGRNAAPPFVLEVPQPKDEGRPRDLLERKAEVFNLVDQWQKEIVEGTPSLERPRRGLSTDAITTFWLWYREGLDRDEIAKQLYQPAPDKLNAKRSQVTRDKDKIRDLAYRHLNISVGRHEYKAGGMDAAKATDSGLAANCA